MKRLGFAITLLLACAAFAHAQTPTVSASTRACAPLAPAAGNIVDVSTVAQLENAVNNATAGTTIRVADGTYTLNGVYLRVAATNVTLRSASGNRDAVVLDGNYITTEIVQIVASNVTIADLTLREAYNHPIHVMSQAGSDTLNTLIYNVHVIDPGEQAIKINSAATGYYTDYGTIACSLMELTDVGRPNIRNNCYTGGVDGHDSRGWVVRDNRIEGFWCVTGLSEHAVHFWTGSRDTLVARNTLVNNARGIGFGLTDTGTGRTYGDNPCPTAVGYVDHYGGIARNNFLFANRAELFSSASGFDCGICVWQTCGAKVLHNTVVSTAAPFSSIEWRFNNTVVDLINNLVSHNLRDRGGTNTQAGNLQNAPLALFVDGANGDLHLLASASTVIDQGAALAPGQCDDDYDGLWRPLGPARDIGADEYGIPFGTFLPLIIK